MVSISGVARLLMMLVLCAVASLALGDDELIALKRVPGGSNLQATGSSEGGSGNGLLGVVAEEEGGASRKSFEGARDPEANEHLVHSEAKLATENALAINLKADMTVSVENSTIPSPPSNSPLSSPPSNSTNVSPPPNASPPPLDPAPTESKNTPAKLPPPAMVANTTTSPPLPEAKSPPIHGGVCEDGPVIGKLVAAGAEDGHRDYSQYTLTVENAGKSKLDVTIKASDGWKATPGVLALAKGQSKSVSVSVTDNEAAKHEAKITVSWSDGDCYVKVPSQAIPSDVDHSSYLAFFNAPGTAALLLGGSLVFLLVLGVAGVWGCISWRARARRHGDVETKYQELEMTLPSTNANQADGSPAADGWDEVWEDDDWQDTEAVRTSSTALTLSSAGLNSRRANKDGWDNSWDD